MILSPSADTLVIFLCPTLGGHNIFPILEEGVPTPIDGAYIYCRDPDASTGSTLNLSYPFTAGTWRISLDITNTVPLLTIYKL